MPIVWKASFEEPLTKLMQTGAIGNPKQLVNQIAILYDACIKQGLPTGPAAVAGPVITGNIIGFKQALNTYFKIDSTIQKSLTIAIYVSIIRQYYALGKELLSELHTTTKTKDILLKQKSANDKIIQNLSDTNEINKILVINNNLIGSSIELSNKINTLRSSYKELVTDKIKDLRADLRETIKRQANFILQNTKLQQIHSISNIIKFITSDINTKKNEITTIIKNLNNKLLFSSKLVESVLTNIEKSKFLDIKRLLSIAIKSTNLQTSINSIAKITSLIQDLNIDSIQKSKILLELNSIIEYKLSIINYKNEIRTYLLNLIKERTTTILSTFLPVFGIKQTKIQSLLQNRSEIQNILLEYKNKFDLLKRNVNFINIFKLELQKIQSNKILINDLLVSQLNTYKPGLGTTYSKINNVTDLKTFLRTQLIDFTNINIILISTIQTIKNEYIASIKDKILSKTINVKENIFNVYLQQALTLYWSGAITSNPVNLGTVLNPGILGLKFSMKQTLNEGDFVRNLSKSLQLHLKTVSGTYIAVPPPTGPILAPWIGYI